MNELSPEDRRDGRLAELLEELVASRRGGGPPDLESIERQDPDLAAELRELWATFRIANEFSRPDAGAESTSFGPASVNDSVSERRSATSELGGEYDILEEVGRGGMGIVYKARQRRLGRLVAVKVMAGGSLASAAERARFQREVEAAARLDHPHIAPVFETGICEQTPFFTMRLLEGRTLASLLASGPLPARQAASVLLPITRALEYAHSRGVLHRDLKPANILFDERGSPYVTDFGLAKRIEPGGTLTQSGAVLGTPSYMPPEQAAGSRGEVGPKSDVYGLGAILYHMLTGRPPFQAASAVDTLLCVLEEDPPAPRVLNRGADRDLEMIALKCLQKPPELRYATAAALADDLEAYLAGDVPSVRSAGFRLLLSRAFRETHHAAILENWGLLWMAHSAVLLALCTLTSVLKWADVMSPLPYVALWGLGLGVWAAAFWALRARSGPVTFVERQIAHVWGASIIASALLFVVELLLGLPVLTLSPVLGLISGMVFFIKAGILSGRFYLQAMACFATAAVMPYFPRSDILVFAAVSAACFFVPGLRAYLGVRSGRRRPNPTPPVEAAGPRDGDASTP